MERQRQLEVVVRSWREAVGDEQRKRDKDFVLEAEREMWEEVQRERAADLEEWRREKEDLLRDVQIEKARRENVEEELYGVGLEKARAEQKADALLEVRAEAQGRLEAAEQDMRKMRGELDAMRARQRQEVQQEVEAERERAKGEMAGHEAQIGALLETQHVLTAKLLEKERCLSEAVSEAAAREAGLRMRLEGEAQTQRQQLQVEAAREHSLLLMLLKELDSAREELAAFCARADTDGIRLEQWGHELQDSLRQSRAEAKACEAACEARLADLQSECQGDKQALHEAKESLHEVKASFEQERVRAEEIEREMDEVRGEICARDERLAMLQARSSALTSEVEALQSSRDADAEGWAREREDLCRQIEMEKGAKEVLEAELREARDAADRRASKATEVESLLAALTEREAERVRELEGSKRACHSLVSKAEEERDELKKERDKAVEEKRRAWLEKERIGWERDEAFREREQALSAKAQEIEAERQRHAEERTKAREEAVQLAGQLEHLRGVMNAKEREWEERGEVLKIKAKEEVRARGEREAAARSAAEQVEELLSERDGLVSARDRERQEARALAEKLDCLRLELQNRQELTEGRARKVSCSGSCDGARDGARDGAQSVVRAGPALGAECQDRSSLSTDGQSRGDGKQGDGNNTASLLREDEDSALLRAQYEQLKSRFDDCHRSAPSLCSPPGHANIAPHVAFFDGDELFAEPSKVWAEIAVVEREMDSPPCTGKALFPPDLLDLSFEGKIHQHAGVGRVETEEIMAGGGGSSPGLEGQHEARRVEVKFDGLPTYSPAVSGGWGMLFPRWSSVSTALNMSVSAGEGLPMGSPEGGAAVQGTELALAVPRVAREAGAQV